MSSVQISPRGVRLLALVVTALGAALCAQAAWIPVKAVTAQLLLKRAWKQSQATGQPVKPWSWADTWPVGTLSSERLGLDLVVLEGATGSSLAFGPGHVAGTAALGAEGNAAVGGHRDTHFAFLEELRPGDVLSVTRPDGEVRRYGVAWTRVVDKADASVLQPTVQTALTLITCWPFHAAVPGGRERYVVRAVELGGSATSGPLAMN